MSTRVAIYARISDARGDDTAGVDRQVKDCTKLADDNEWAVVGTFIDNSVSAYSGRTRPQYEKMMAAVRSGDIDTIAVWSADRLYRRMADLERLVDELGKTNVATVKSGKVDLSTADGRMTARILGSVAQHESEKRGERVGRAFRERIEKGKWAGGPRRYGYNADATKLVPAEARELRKAYKAIAAGASLRSVIVDMNNRGILSAQGKNWSAATFRRMMLRPMNAGHAEYKGRLIEGASEAPAIVDPALWAQVHAILNDPTRRTNAGAPRTTLLSGIARCGVCDGPVRAGSRQSGVHTYRCQDNACVTRRRVFMDELINATMKEYLTANQSVLAKAVSDQDDTDAAVGVALTEAARLRSELETLPMLLADGSLGATDYATATGKVRERLAVVESSISAQSHNVAATTLLQSNTIGDAWERLDVEKKRIVMREFIDHIRIDRVGKSRNKATAEGIHIIWKADQL